MGYVADDSPESVLKSFGINIKMVQWLCRRMSLFSGDT